MLAITLRTELTLSGAEAMARQVVDPAVLWMRKLSGGRVTFIASNMKVMVGEMMGTV